MDRTIKGLTKHRCRYAKQTPDVEKNGSRLLNQCTKLSTNTDLDQELSTV